MRLLLLFIVISALVWSCSSDTTGEAEDTDTVIVNDTVYHEKAEEISFSIPAHCPQVTSEDELYAAMENAKAGDSIYIIESIELKYPLSVKKKKGLSLIGASENGEMATLFNHEEELFIIELEECENIVIESLQMFHDSDFGCSAGVVSIMNCKDVTVRFCDIHGSGAYGFFTGGECEDIFIIHNNIHDCTYWGIEVYCDNVTISDNTFYHNGNTGRDNINLSPQVLVAAIRDNHYIGADHHHYINKVDNRIKTGSEYSKREINTSQETVTGYFDDTGDLVYAEYSITDNYEKNIKIYFKNQEPVYIYEMRDEPLYPEYDDGDYKDGADEYPDSEIYEAIASYYNGHIARLELSGGEERPAFEQEPDTEKIIEKEDYYKQVIDIIETILSVGDFSPS